jgi:ATP-dependent Lon protease
MADDTYNEDENVENLANDADQQDNDNENYKNSDNDNDIRIEIVGNLDSLDDLHDHHEESDTVDEVYQSIETTEGEIVEDNDARGIALPNENLPEVIPILPLTERPFFPNQALPVMMDRDTWSKTLKKVMEKPPHLVGLVLADSDQPNKANTSDFHKVGTVCRIHTINKNGDDLHFIAQGIKRFEIQNFVSVNQPFAAKVRYPEISKPTQTEELRAYSMAVINTLKELMPINPLYSEELKQFAGQFSTSKPSALADFAAMITSAEKEELQDILSTFPILERLKKVIALLKKELEVAKLQNNIQNQVNEKMSEQQRQFFLREQLKVIQKELGISKDDRTADIERFTERLKNKTVPEKAQQRIDDEIDKLSILETGSPEYGVTRNYLDVITELPWGKTSKDKLDLKRARRVLDKGHYGLDDVKERIVEFLATGKLRGEVRGSIILLVGPPGVGKTSIGSSIADALGREFYRFSVGGMRDEAEIKGHRRTYIGAMPGKLIQALNETQTENPVIMLDEIDKLASSYQGDPASALLEVLDPEQNSNFLDHYLDVRVDLSKVLFVCTANQIDSIPRPLYDRMEVIRLAGYITKEKVEIGKRHLWPRLLERAGATKQQLKISVTALRKIAEGYAREAGVRNMEKQLARIIRKSAVKLVENLDQTISITPKEVENYLGKPVYTEDSLTQGVGVVTGLAWTAAGGATLNIEVTEVHQRNSGLKLSGRLGETMQESAGIAQSFTTANLERYGADSTFFDKRFIHLHVPEGATPKDGPSAGVTMTTALLSLALNKKPKKIAMTGELTLTGQVLAIGGVREKLVASRRNGYKTVIFPAANQRDYEELPNYITEGMTVFFAKHYDDVAKIMFDITPTKKAKKKASTQK